MPKRQQDEHRIIWRNPKPRHDAVNIICACETKFRDGIRTPAEQLWQLHRVSLEGKP